MYETAYMKTKQKDSALWEGYEKYIEKIEKLREEKKFSGNTREAIAKELGVSSSKIAQIEYVRGHAIPEIKQLIADGKMSISTARSIARMRESEQALYTGCFPSNLQDELYKRKSVQKVPAEMRPIKASKLKELLEKTIDVYGDTDVVVEVYNRTNNSGADAVTLPVTKVCVDSSMVLEDDLESSSNVRLIVHIN